MKQFKIIQAYKTLESLAPINTLNEQEQWEIYQLRKQLRPHFEFQQEREEALFEKYKEFSETDGTLKGEKADEYLKELNNINNMDIDIKMDIKPKIRLVKGITFITAEQLEDFIEFIPS